MLCEINRKQFIADALSVASYIWTDIIRDSLSFESKYYFDETNIFYLSINYGSGETITIFSPYSDALVEKAKKFFPYAIGFIFACSIEEYKNAYISEKHSVLYHYKFSGKKDRCETDVVIQKIHNDSVGILKKYDDTYLSFLREDHGARLLNFWNRNKERIERGDKAMYLALKYESPIGFVMIDFYNDLNACDIAQITIEEPFQNKGYGKQLLERVVDELLEAKYDIYYSSVNDDNIASQKTCEHVGFKAVACRISVPIS